MKKSIRLICIVSCFLILIFTCGCSKTEIPIYEVKYDSQNGGYVVGDTYQYVDSSGVTTQVEAIASEGCRFVGWSDGLKTAVRTDSNVSDNVTYTAEFEKIEYVTVNYFADVGGKIIGESSQKVEKGDVCTEVRAVSDDGYVFVGWSDGTDSEYHRELCVEESKNIIARFEKEVTVEFASSNAKQGKIIGKTTQTILKNDKTQEVTAIPTLGYKFSSWSNGEESEEITVTATENEVVYANFEIDSRDFPSICIYTENGADIVSKDTYINCTVSVSNTIEAYEFSNESAKIRGRGNTTWSTSPKKPYRIKFDSKTDLFGNGSDKDWTLIANYSDPSMARNYLAYIIGSVMDDLQYTTSIEYVDLYINDTYMGVYTVCEQIETGKSRVNIDESSEYVDTGYLIELDGRAVDEGRVEGVDYFVIEDTMFVLKTPDPDDEGFNTDFVEYIKSYFENTFDALNSENYDNVLEYIDVNTFADSYIVHEMLKMVDVGYSSFYVYKDKDGKLCSGPLWDFDLSCGNCDYNEDCIKTDYLWAKANNIFYSKLFGYGEFEKLVAEKLEKYREKILLLLDFEKEYLFERTETFERNFERWNTLGTYVWPNSPELVAIDTWQAHVEYVIDFAKTTLDYMTFVYCDKTE